MALINWNENLSVKINSIDEQHKKLIDLINDFYENIQSCSSQENLIKLISGMKKYTLHHFTAEENYMRNFNYPEYAAHKIEHEIFLSKVIALEEKLKSGKLIISIEITGFLKDWLKTHIQVVDKKYSNYLIANGVK